MEKSASTQIPERPDRIDLTNPAEVAFWCEKMAIHEWHLRQAVETVGPRRREVEKYLRRLHIIHYTHSCLHRQSWWESFQSYFRSRSSGLEDTEMGRHSL